MPAHSPVEETGGTEALSDRARIGCSWMRLLGEAGHKNIATSLEISERSLLEPAVSAGPEVSLRWCVWGVGKVRLLSTLLHDPWKMLRGNPNKRDWGSRER